MNKKTPRQDAKLRREEILKAGLLVAEKHGYSKVTREKIAAELEISGPAIQYHFRTMQQLRNDLMRFAVKKCNLRVIAQGIAANDKTALKAPAGLRRQALEAIGQ